MSSCQFTVQIECMHFYLVSTCFRGFVARIHIFLQTFLLNCFPIKFVEFTHSHACIVKSTSCKVEFLVFEML